MLPALILPEYVFSDKVILLNGQSLDGKVQILEDGSVKLTLTKGGTVTFDKHQVANIEYGLTTLEEYEKKRKSIAQDSALDHFMLGLWCRKHNLHKEAEQEFRATLTIRPDHPEAHRLLGHRREGDEWITQVEYHKRRGKVLYKGRWMTEKEKARQIQEEKAKALLKKLMGLIYKASRQSGKNAESALETLLSHPPKAVNAALIQALNNRESMQKFAMEKLAARKVVHAAEAMVKVTLEGTSGTLRLAGLEALQKLDAEKTWYFLSKYLYNSSGLRRIYALQSLMLFKDMRSVPYILHSFPLAWEGNDKATVIADVTHTYVKGYELVPVNQGGRRITHLVKPLIGGIQLGAGSPGTGIADGPMSSDEKMRRAEVFLRFKTLEELTGQPFGADLAYWTDWWKSDGKTALEAFHKEKLKTNTKQQGQHPLPKSPPPPSLPD